MITQVRRNFWIHHYLDDSRLKPLFLPRNIKALENADKYHYIALLGGIFLFPMLIFDPILFLGLCFYLVIAFTIATINLFHLKVLRIKAIPQNVTALLSSSQFAYIGTNSPNQIPHITPTLFVYDGKHIFISTSIKSAKVNNLRRRKKIAVCIEYRKRNDISKSEGVLIQGQARIYGDNIILGLLFVMILGLKMFYIRTLFQKKYPDYLKYYNERKQFLPSAWRTLPLLSRTIIEIIPNRYIYWKGTKFSQIHA